MGIVHSDNGSIERILARAATPDVEADLINTRATLAGAQAAYTAAQERIRTLEATAAVVNQCLAQATEHADQFELAAMQRARTR